MRISPQTRQKLQVFDSTRTQWNCIESDIISSILGFGTFGKQTGTPIDAEDLNTEDLESKRVQEIMGISEFGRKAKTFDITVRLRLLMTRFRFGAIY